MLHRAAGTCHQIPPWTCLGLDRPERMMQQQQELERTRRAMQIQPRFHRSSNRNSSSRSLHLRSQVQANLLQQQCRPPQARPHRHPRASGCLRHRLPWRVSDRDWDFEIQAWAWTLPRLSFPMRRGPLDLLDLYMTSKEPHHRELVHLHQADHR